MLANLPPDAAAYWFQPKDYRVLRGWAFEKLLCHVFSDGYSWWTLSKFPTKKLAARLLEISCSLDCPFTPQFMREHPMTAVWLAGCFRRLFNCLKAWDVRWARSGPRLPVFGLPNDGYFDPGEPDLLLYSEKRGGLFVMEVKTGIVPVKPDKLKIARYHAGTLAWIEECKPAAKLIGSYWMSFSTTRFHRDSGIRIYDEVPIMKLNFFPFHPMDAEKRLHEKFGFPILDLLPDLPRLPLPQKEDSLTTLFAPA